MVISGQNTVQADTQAATVRPLSQPELHGGERQDLRMQLSEVLQSSLELDTLLNVFLEKVSTAVRLDGIYYTNEEQGINARIAKQAAHSCGYRLITSDDRLGEIVFKRSKKFTEKELGVLESLLSPLIFPLRNSLQYTRAVNAARKDALTGAHNISTLPETLNREIGLAKRHNESLSVVMIDVDHLLKLNAQYGHSNGDRILAAVAQRIMQLCRTTDTVFRYEDDQFLVILSSTGKAGAQVIASRIRQNIKEMQLPFAVDEKETPRQTISIAVGIAELTGTDSSSSLLERADKAMHAAKRRAHN